VPRIRPSITLLAAALLLALAPAAASHPRHSGTHRTYSTSHRTHTYRSPSHHTKSYAYGVH